MEDKNLMAGLLEEMNRVREIITEYESLPKGAGVFAATAMKNNIKLAEKAISSNDIVEMLRQYNDLKSWER